MDDIPDSEVLREIRKRAKAVGKKFTSQADRDRRDLLLLLDDIIEQASDGCFAEHECPALFACTYIIAQTCEPEETEGKGGQRG